MNLRKKMMIQLILIALWPFYADATSEALCASISEYWFERPRVEIKLDPKFPQINVVGSYLEISSPMPFVALRTGEANDLPQLTKGLKTNKREFSLPLTPSSQNPNLDFAFDYLSWLEKKVLAGTPFKLNYVLIGKSDFLHLGQKTKAEFVSVNKNSQRYQISQPEDHKNLFFRSFGVGRPKDVYAPEPIREISYGIFNDQIVTIESISTMRLNPIYNPTITKKNYNYVYCDNL